MVCAITKKKNSYQYLCIIIQLLYAVQAPVRHMTKWSILIGRLELFRRRFSFIVAWYDNWQKKKAINDNTLVCRILGAILHLF